MCQYVRFIWYTAAPDEDPLYSKSEYPFSRMLAMSSGAYNPRNVAPDNSFEAITEITSSLKTNLHVDFQNTPSKAVRQMTIEEERSGEYFR